MDFNLGDILTCSNKRNYKLVKGDHRYPIALIDEFGEEVTKTHDYCIREAIGGERLCVGLDYNGDIQYTQVLAINGEPIISASLLEMFVEFTVSIVDGTFNTYEEVAKEARKLLDEHWYK